MRNNLLTIYRHPMKLPTMVHLAYILSTGDA